MIMKRILVFILLVISFILSAIPVDRTQVENKAREFIIAKQIARQIGEIETIKDQHSKTIAYLAVLQPQGFVLLSADDEIHPILAYSFQSNFTSQTDELEIMQFWLEKVYSSYLHNLLIDQKMINQEKWREPISASTRFQQWPEPGTTSTGGWLETNWSQSYPFNQYCPTDPTTGTICVAGCPSIVMAQIINYHRRINNVRFDDEDDYHMYYNGSNNYIIDDDAALHGFPSFMELNDYLSEIETVYNGLDELPDPLKAALVFAGGVAIKQVYSAGSSGNYYDQQIINGFRKFGFDMTELLWEYEPLVFNRLAENMKAALPARLGILAPSAGHQIVVDGYNTDEEYHFNFGWGGSSNGWYSFPLTGMPYQLNIFGSVDIDINQTWAGCPDFEIIYPPAGSVLTHEAFIPVHIESTGYTLLDSVNIFLDNDLIQTGYHPVSCDIDMSLLGNGVHKISVIGFAADKKIRSKTVDFEILRGNVIFAENFDGSWENDWEIISSNTDHTWQILENSLESFSETNSNSTASATCPLAYANLNEVMISPEIQLPLVDELQWHFYAGFCDRYPNYPAISGAVSNDHGQSWNILWQTSPTIEEWTWKHVLIDLSSFAGESVQLKYTCSGFSYADVSVDGIRIIEPQEVPAQNDLVSPDITLTNFPNPFNPSTEIRFQMSQVSESAEIVIYNIRGQKIKTLPVSPSPSHTVTLNWNGDDQYNQLVSTGVYFYQLQVDGKPLASRKMLMLK